MVCPNNKHQRALEADAYRATAGIGLAGDDAARRLRRRAQYSPGCSAGRGAKSGSRSHSQVDAAGRINAAYAGHYRSAAPAGVAARAVLAAAVGVGSVGVCGAADCGVGVGALGPIDRHSGIALCRSDRRSGFRTALVCAWRCACSLRDWFFVLAGCRAIDV